MRRKNKNTVFGYLNELTNNNVPEFVVGTSTGMDLAVRINESVKRWNLIYCKARESGFYTNKGLLCMFPVPALPSVEEIASLTDQAEALQTVWDDAASNLRGFPSSPEQKELIYQTLNARTDDTITMEDVYLDACTRKNEQDANACLIHNEVSNEIFSQGIELMYGISNPAPRIQKLMDDFQTITTMVEFLENLCRYGR